MRRTLMIMTICTTLFSPGCTMAKASAADPKNPAQCIAAFQWGHDRLQRSPTPTTSKYRTALSLTARQLYYIQKLKGSGLADGGEAETRAFAAAHGNDEALLEDLMGKCLEVQDGEPDVAESIANLTPLVLKVDPICRESPSVCQLR